MARKIANHDQVFHKALGHQVEPLETVHGTQYRVTSGTSGLVYVVTLGEQPRCTCDRQPFIGAANEYTNGCSHVQAVVAYLEGVNGNSVKSRPADADLSRLHRRQISALHGDNVVFTTRRKTGRFTVAQINEMLGL